MEYKIQALEISMAEFKKEIGFIKSVQAENREQNSKEHQEIIKKMDEFIDGCDQKYAQKDTQWAEKFLTWVGTIVGAAVILGLLALLATGYIHLNK